MGFLISHTWLDRLTNWQTWPNVLLMSLFIINQMVKPLINARLTFRQFYTDLTVTFASHSLPSMSSTFFVKFPNKCDQLFGHSLECYLCDHRVQKNVLNYEKNVVLSSRETETALASIRRKQRLFQFFRLTLTNIQWLLSCPLLKYHSFYLLFT